MVVVAFIGGIGGWEVLLLVAVILLVFGPDRMPEMIRKVATASQKLRLANRDFQREIYREIGRDDEPLPKLPPNDGADAEPSESPAGKR